MNDWLLDMPNTANTTLHFKSNSNLSIKSLYLWNWWVSRSFHFNAEMKCHYGDCSSDHGDNGCPGICPRTPHSEHPSSDVKYPIDPHPDSFLFPNNAARHTGLRVSSYQVKSKSLELRVGPAMLSKTSRTWMGEFHQQSDLWYWRVPGQCAIITRTRRMQRGSGNTGSYWPALTTPGIIRHKYLLANSTLQW